MRRIALLGLLLPLAGCAGFGHFVGDTFSGFGSNPNAPVGDSENMLRARGDVNVNVPPLRQEPGDIWPGPPAPEPTLSQLEKQSNQNLPPALGQPSMPAPQVSPRHRRPVTRGSSTPPGSNQPGLPQPSLEAPSPPPISEVAPPPPAAGQVIPAPGGPVTTTGRTGSVQTTTPPAGMGGQGILIPNGNGTSTLILPNGQVQTVQTPK